MSNAPENTAVIDPATGKPMMVKTGEMTALQNSKSNLGGFFELQELGLDPDKEAFADAFQLPGLSGFTWRIRMVSAKIKENDDAFPMRAVAELGLDMEAKSQLEREDVEDVSETAINERALRLLQTEAFRADPKKSALFNQMVKERYDAVIIGSPDSNDPADWGGLVKWISPTLPFTPQNARATNIKVKVQLYTRILGLAVYGADDAQFRQNSR